MTCDGDPRPAPPWGDDLHLGVFANVEIPRRLIDGPVFSGLPPDERWALMRLLFASWHEKPAGSLPADPASLADRAGFGMDVAAWLAMQDRVLQSWTACNDDRLYFLPWEDVLADAFGRVRKTRKGDNNRRMRSRIKAELAEIGIPQVDQITTADLDPFIAAWVGNGGKELRGARRKDALISLASDFGMLPGQVPNDVRLTARFKSISGGATGSD